MNTENPGASEGSRTNSPSSGSQVSGSVELPVKLVTESAAMDHEMRTLENKVKRKLEEEQRLLEAKNSNLSTLESVTKQLILLQDREHSIFKSSNREKDGDTRGEGLELAVIQNLKAIKISTDEQKFSCNNIIEKYSTIISLHQESFAALPWVNEKKQMSVGVAKKRVIFDLLKMRQQRYKAKLRQLERISESRQRFEVVCLSILMIEREKTLKLVRKKDATKRSVEQEIRSLEQQKSAIQEKIASRTQEMILRIMNRSNDGPSKTPAPNAAWSNITMREEMNKSMDRSIKDRLGIRKRQENEKSAKSIRDRIGISKKQVSDSLKIIEWRQPCEDGVKETASLSASVKHSFTKYPGRKGERSRSPSSTEGNAVGSTEICSIENTNAVADCEEGSEIRNDQAVQNSLLPESEGWQDQEANPVFTEIPSPITVGIPCRPPPLKAILKPSTSLQSKRSEMSPEKAIPAPSLKPPLLSETDDISMAQIASEDDASVTYQPSYTHVTVITPGDVCGGVDLNGKRSVDGHLQPDDGLENALDGPAPKKPRVSQKVLPPCPTTGAQRQQKKSSQAHKRVSFVPHEEENREVSDLPTDGKGSSSKICNRNLTPQPTVLTTDSEQTSPKKTEPASEELIKPVDGSTKVPSPRQPPALPEKDVASKPTGDEFQHLFSPSPQPFSTPQQQTTPGNFDSIFGAIFNIPDTSKDNAGFQFNVQGDAQKQNTSNDGANTTPNAGQDFFSFFGTPNASEAKKSYTDNFFKLF